MYGQQHGQQQFFFPPNPNILNLDFDFYDCHTYFWLCWKHFFAQFHIIYSIKLLKEEKSVSSGLS